MFIPETGADKSWREFWFDYSIQTFLDYMPDCESEQEERKRKEIVTNMVTQNIDIASFKKMEGAMAGYFMTNTEIL